MDHLMGSSTSRVASNSRTDRETNYVLTAADWEARRSEFKKLYLEENLSLPEIMKIMAQNHNFHATKRQFDKRIKEWGLRKNLKRKDAIAMLKKRSQRLMAERKETEFTFNGLPVAIEKLQRHASGHQPGDSPAATPEYVQYRTPTNSNPETASEHLYETPRADIDTPMAQNSETCHPRLSHDQHINPLSNNIQSPLGTYTDPAYIPSTEDTEMFDTESVSPGNEPPFSINPSIEREQFPGNTNDSAVGDNAERLCQILHGNDQTELEIFRLIWSGVDLCTRCNCCSNTPLHLTAQYGYDTVARLLLEKGADVSASNVNSWAPLHLAAENGHEAVARLLIEKGADVSAPNVNSWTPLHLAVFNGHEAVARLLLEKGADVSALFGVDSWTPLHLAAQEGHEAVARLLLEKGADVSALAREESLTPLHLAALHGHEAVARLLLEKGADVSALGFDSWTPLHSAALGGHEVVARLLLEKGADVSALADDSWTPLHLAALNDHEAVARLLLEKGADVSAFEDDRRTPLHLAALHGYEAVARLLLEKGADVSALAGEESSTPLHLAAQYGYEAVTRLLLEKGADVSALADDSWTPLHSAAFNGHEAVARLLLEKGANVAALGGRNSQTPLHLAAKQRHIAVARLLFEKGTDVYLSLIF